jgi:hypothetical protein
VRRAVDEAGNAIDFSKVTFENSVACLIDGVRCRADEAYFGGIVVRPARNA